MISNSGKGETGFRNQQAGDQTGKEWAIIPWYNYSPGGWNYIMRHPDSAVRATLSNLSILAAKNDRIGYDMNDRTTYWSQLQKVGYDPSKITIACEDDCSAGVMSNVKAAGYLLGLPRLQSVPIVATYTMKETLEAAGFTCLSDRKYLTSEAYLLPGDILLNVQHHTCMAVGNGVLLPDGKLYGATGTASTATVAVSHTAENIMLNVARHFDNSAKAGKKFIVETNDNSGLNMRTGAGTDKGKILNIPDGKTVTWYGYYNVDAKGARWYLVIYSGKTGYVHSGYLV